MLRIRNEQITVLSQVVLRDFEERAITHLRKDLAPATEGVSDEELRKQVREGFQQANCYGFRSERHVVSFVDASVLLGRGFVDAKENAWARQILLDAQLSSEEKARWLLLTASDIYFTRRAKGGKQ